MSDLEDFIKENPDGRTKRSVLEPYREEILKLKELNYTQVSILRFLAEKKQVRVSQQTLNWFIRTRTRERTEPLTVRESAPAETIPSDRKETEPASGISAPIPEIEEKSQTAAPYPAKQQQTDTDGGKQREEPKKFEWPPQFNKDEWM